MKQIKLFITDLDGTLTNGKYYVSDKGNITKGFYTRDFFGLRLLHESGVNVCIVTGSKNKCNYYQIKRSANFASFYQKVDNKLNIAQELIKELNISFDEVAFIGDDYLDRDLLAMSGFPACPFDAHSDIIDFVATLNGFMSKYNGGEGCVRDFSDLVRKNNKTLLELELNVLGKEIK